MVGVFFISFNLKENELILLFNLSAPFRVPNWAPLETRWTSAVESDKSFPVVFSGSFVIRNQSKKKLLIRKKNRNILNLSSCLKPVDFAFDATSVTYWAL